MGDDRYPVDPRARGLGTAVVPRSLAEEAGDAVAILELAGVPARRTIALLWVVDRPQAAAPRTFVAFARDWLGAPRLATGTLDG